MKLNKQQIDFVDCNFDSLVLACPGSGKTRSICSKIVRLSNELKDTKKKILNITYTNKAADEIHDRISIDGGNLKNVWIGTIHGFCLEWVLRGFQSSISELCRGFSVADEFFVNGLIGELKKKHEINPFDSINFKFDRDGSPLEADAKKKKLVLEYRQILSDKKLIDFDQILLICHNFLLGNSRASKLLADLFAWVIVDEYQDTQPLQYYILAAMAKANNDLRVSFVGDPDQAVYTTLGGLALSKAELQKEFGRSFVEHIFFGCYRSNQHIVDFYSRYKSTAGKIISQVDSHHQPMISIDKRISIEELSKEIVRIIRLESARGVADKDICVIAPQWDMLNKMVKSIKANLPEKRIDSPGLSPIYRNKENVWYHLARILLTESSPQNLRRRRRWARECIEAFGAIVDLKDVRSEMAFLELCNRSKSSESGGLDFILTSFDAVVGELNIELEIYPILRQQLDVFINGTKDRIKQWDIEDKRIVFKSFFTEGNGIIVNTCQGVKGLEFGVVIAFGLVEGKVPHWDVILGKKFDPENEARKILYVISSRAKERLYLFCERGHKTKKGMELRATSLVPDRN